MRGWSRSVKAVSLLLTLAGAGASSRGASPPAPRLVLVLDASGSMWGQIGGENKIAIARRVLRNLIAELPDGSEVGLVAYGHRREGDCADIETLSPLAPIDRGALARQIERLTPKGKTPITGAVLEALKIVRSQDRSTTVVLVSDGLETCGGDPCSTVREARQAGVSFVMHVVGFDVEEGDVSQLECTAQAGGGLYFTARNAEELTKALDQAIDAPAEVPPGGLSVKTSANGKLVDAVVRVRRAQGSQDVASGRTYTSGETNPRVIHLPDGAYDVEVDAISLEGSGRRTFQGVEIQEGRIVEMVVDFGTGQLTVTVTRNGSLSDATVQVLVAGTKDQIAAARTYRKSSSNPTVFNLTAGRYDVVVGSVEIAGKPRIRFDDVSVETGGRVERSHEFSSGTLRVGAVEGARLVDAVVTVADLETGKEVDRGRTYERDSSNPRSFELVSGGYRVTVTPVRGKQSATEFEVTVEAGTVTERVASFSMPPGEPPR